MNPVYRQHLESPASDHNSLAQKKAPALKKEQVPVFNTLARTIAVAALVPLL